MSGVDADLAVINRLASLVCEPGEVTIDDVRAGLAASIDQTLLDPLAGPEHVAAWARDNAFEGFATLCVQPCNVARVSWELAQLESATRTCCVLSFPQGQDAPESVCFSTAFALAAGASELDLVMNYGAFLEGSYDDVAAPILSVLQTIDAGDDEDEDEGECCDEQDGSCTCGHEHDGSCTCGHDHDHDDEDDEDEEHDHDHEERPLLKVILETGVLTSEQVCEACDLVSSLGIDFVKTSTGFGPRGASVDDVRLMCATVEPGVRVKAAGGVRTLEGALELLEAGAERLGTSRGKEILAEFDALAARVAGADA